MKCKGAEIVVKCLIEQGVDTVFGYPGGTILDIYDALYKYRKQIRHIRTSHEQGAAHAADGYARASGRVGVCLATSGPGSTNLVTGLATAYMDSIPVVAITCNVTNALLGKDSFQEVDITGVTMPITKHSFIVKHPDHLAEAMRKAFSIARSGRPGPVLVDITKDTTQMPGEYEPAEKKSAQKKKQTVTAGEIDDAVKMIRESRRPFLYVGGGAIASGAEKELQVFADKVQAPVCISLMGKGAFDEESPLFTGMIGMHGTKTSNLGVSSCDLLIALGARFSDRVIGNPKTFAQNAKILHIDIDPAEVNKNIRADLSLTGDLRQILHKLNAALPQQKHAAWLKEIKTLKETYPLRTDCARLTGPAVIEALCKKLPERTIVTTDVGQHQMWTAQYYRAKHPRTFLSSGGLGTMGFGLGAAIGAKAAHPERTVVNITGDGCFRMNMNELATASAYGLPVIEIIFDNHTLGMVRQWQTLFYGKTYSATDIVDPVDYSMIARGMGCDAYRVTTIAQLEEAVGKALSAKKTVVIDCVIDTDDSVFPMVPAGKSIADAFDEEDLKKGGR